MDTTFWREQTFRNLLDEATLCAAIDWLTENEPDGSEADLANLVERLPIVRRVNTFGPWEAVPNKQGSRIAIRRPGWTPRGGPSPYFVLYMRTGYLRKYTRQRWIWKSWKSSILNAKNPDRVVGSSREIRPFIMLFRLEDQLERLAAHLERLARRAK